MKELTPQHKEDIERIERIKQDLWILGSRDICLRDEHRIFLFSEFLNQYKSDLTECMDIEKREMKQ